MSKPERSPLQRPAETSREILPLIAGRWSGRAIDVDRPVPRASLERLLEAGRWSASCFNDQPWEYLIFSEENSGSREKARSALVDANSWARSAPVLILSLARKKFRQRDRINRFGAYDTGMATAQMALQAQEEGLVFHQMAGYKAPVLKEAFAISDDLEPMALIAVGYPGDPATLSDEKARGETAPRERRPLEAFAHWV